jgi:tetratricopeptide (TPR) repeat protein
VQIYIISSEDRLFDIKIILLLLSRIKIMTVSEANNLYDRIVGQILNSNLRDAFVNLGYLIQQNGFGLAFDQLNELESNYKYLLRFRLEGVSDPEKDKVYTDLRRKAINLADDALQIWMSQHSPQLYYDRLRAGKIEQELSIEKLVTELKNTGDKLVLVELVDDASYRKSQVMQLTKLREHIASQIFIRIWISGNWSGEDLQLYHDIFSDMAIMNYEKALFVSALLLSLLHRFDEEKFFLLIDLCSDSDPEISQRAIVALSVSMYVYDERISIYPSIGQKMDALMDDDTQKNALKRVLYQLVRSKDTENVTKKMQEEILPEMTRFGSTMHDKMRQEEGEDASDEFNPDWKNMLEDPGLSVKIQEFSDMQLEGIDVYMSTFSGQKFYPFFHEMSNWFLPFYSSHSSLAELFYNKPAEGISIMDAVLKSGYLCSSDKFSFCFNLLQIPANYRSSMANSMGADSEMYEEFKKSESAMNPGFLLELASNRYIQDLYRFFNLFGRKRDFNNIFSFPLDLHNAKSLSKYLSSEDTLRKIGLLYFKNKNYKYALSIIEELLKINPAEAELHQKKGYCLQQLDRKKEALDAYLEAELIQPDSLWTLKRIAAIYRFEKNPVKAIEFYRRAEKLTPDDVILTLNIGHAMVEAADFAGALQVYFKAELMSEESLKTWRPIAWCSLMCKKYLQAGKYYDKILQHNPTIEDYLNAGHLEWCKGSPLKAIEVYKRGIRATHTPFPDFLEMFQKDVKTISILGINEDDIPFVRDELFYALEE